MTTTPASDEPEPLWLTTKQVARLLQVSERTLHDIAKDGALPRVKLGARGLRYRVSDVKKFAETFSTAA